MSAVTYIAYDNILPDSAITDSGNITNIENAYDYNSYDSATADDTAEIVINIDAGSAKPCSAICLGSKTTLAGVSISVEYSDNDITYTEAYNDTISTDQLYMRVFDDYTYRYWRITITQSATPLSIFHLSLGTALLVPNGITPSGFTRPKFSHRDKIVNNVSQGGQFLGRLTQRRGKSFKITLKNLSVLWVDNYWEDFINHARLKPFVLQWDSTSYESEAVYCWIADAENLPVPSYKSPRLQDVTLMLEAL